MTPENERIGHADGAAPGGDTGSEGPSAARVLVDLHSECERLRQEVRRLEEERDAACRACEEARAERDSYRRMAYDVARKQFEERLPLTPEGLQRLILTEKWSPLEDLLEELERNPNGP